MINMVAVYLLSLFAVLPVVVCLWAILDILDQA